MSTRQYPPAGPNEPQRRLIITRLLDVEFGGHLHERQAWLATPPERWQEVLGEHISRRILARAARVWETEKAGRHPE